MVYCCVPGAAALCSSVHHRAIPSPAVSAAVYCIFQMQPIAWSSIRRVFAYRSSEDGRGCGDLAATSGGKAQDKPAFAACSPDCVIHRYWRPRHSQGICSDWLHHRCHHKSTVCQPGRLIWGPSVHTLQIQQQSHILSAEASFRSEFVLRILQLCSFRGRSNHVRQRETMRG